MSNPGGRESRIDTRFQNELQQPVGTLIQAGSVTIGAQQSESAWPLRVGVVPGPAAARQRRVLDDALTAALARNEGVVLTGMGGVGKTQIAAKYAEDQWCSEAIDLLIWVNAASPDTIVSRLAQAAVEVCGCAPDDPAANVDALLSWLARPTGKRWLIVFDDLADPNDLRGFWPPPNARGRTVVTTRRRDAALHGDRRAVLDVGLFTPPEAMEYLEERLSRQERSTEGAARLAEALEHLPIALAQATAYILDHPGMTCADFADRVADRGRELETLTPDALPDDYPNSVTAAFMLSIEHAEPADRFGLASSVMLLASVLDPNGIPVEIFQTESSLVPHKVIVGQETVGGVVDVHPDEVLDMLARLTRLNVIDFDGRTVRMHSLIQRVVRDESAEDTIDAITLVAADALSEAWSGRDVDLDLEAVLRANIENVRSHAPTGLITDTAHPVLVQAGASLRTTGHFLAAAAYFEVLEAECRAKLGESHPDTLVIRHIRAGDLGAMGKIAEAIEKNRILLDESEAANGADHENTLVIRDTLADLYGEAGNAARALASLGRLRDDRIRILGADHPSTLRTRHRIAEWLGRSGNPDAAVRDFAALLEDRVRVLGPDDSEVLVTRLSLASWKGLAGDRPGAMAAFEKLLPDCVRAFGPLHGDTLSVRNNLADLRGHLIGPERAVPDFIALLDEHLEVFGPDHPDTFITRSNLAHWRGECGDAEGAAAEHMSLLLDRLRVLGPKHPKTVSSFGQALEWMTEEEVSAAIAESGWKQRFAEGGT